MRAREYLNQLKQLKAKVELTEAELSDLEFMLKAIRTDAEMSTSGDNDKVLHRVERIIDMREKYNKELDEYLQSRLEIVSKICRLENELYIKVVYDHKCQEMPFKEIAKKYNYSVSHIRNTYSLAIRELEKLINDSTK